MERNRYKGVSSFETEIIDLVNLAGEWKLKISDNRLFSSILDETLTDLMPVKFEAKIFTTGSEITRYLSIVMNNNDSISFVIKSFKIQSERDGLTESLFKYFLMINNDEIPIIFFQESIPSFNSVKNYYFYDWLPRQEYDINRI